MLGLEHSFFKDVAEATDTNDKLGDLPRGNGVKSIADRKKEIEGLITFQKKYNNKNHEKLKELKAKNNPLEKKKIKDLEEDIDNTNKSITRQRDKLRKIDIIKICGLKTTKEKSKNYMDYIADRTYFAKYQSEIAKKECIDFYK